MNALIELQRTPTGVLVQPDCSALRRYLEIIQYENRGGNYRKHPVEGERERAAQDGLRAMRQLEYALERIAKAQND